NSPCNSREPSRPLERGRLAGCSCRRGASAREPASGFPRWVGGAGGRAYPKCDKAIRPAETFRKPGATNLRIWPGPMTRERTTNVPDTSVLPRSVRRALDAMQAAVGRDIGLADLAAAAGLSGRALQRQFRVFVGKTPHEVLRDIRFEVARRKLL